MQPTRFYFIASHNYNNNDENWGNMLLELISMQQYNKKRCLIKISTLEIIISLNNFIDGKTSEVLFTLFFLQNASPGFQSCLVYGTFYSTYLVHSHSTFSERYIWSQFHKHFFVNVHGFYLSTIQKHITVVMHNEINVQSQFIRSQLLHVSKLRLC